MSWYQSIGQNLAQFAKSSSQNLGDAGKFLADKFKQSGGHEYAQKLWNGEKPKKYQGALQQFLDTDLVKNLYEGPKQIGQGLKTIYGALNTYGDALNATNNPQYTGIWGTIKGLGQTAVQSGRGTYNAGAGALGVAAGLLHTASSVAPIAAALGGTYLLGKAIKNKLSKKRAKPEEQISFDFIQQMNKKNNKKIKYASQFNELPTLKEARNAQYAQNKIQPVQIMKQYNVRPPGPYLNVQKEPVTFQMIGKMNNKQNNQLDQFDQ